MYRISSRVKRERSSEGLAAYDTGSSFLGDSFGGGGFGFGSDDGEDEKSLWICGNGDEKGLVRAWRRA